MQIPLTDREYLLEKFPGKGGWTYARIPEILKDKKAPFGWVKVKGSIDGVEIKKYHLMPMGNGKLFLPVNATLRKKIKKSEGDFVHVILYPDNEPIEIPEEFMLCLHDEPDAWKFFMTLADSEKQYYIKWIYGSKTDDTRVDRMAKAINRLVKNKKYHDIPKIVNFQNKS